jgi:hypothetical protein
VKSIPAVADCSRRSPKWDGNPIGVCTYLLLASLISAALGGRGRLRVREHELRDDGIDLMSGVPHKPDLLQRAKSTGVGYNPTSQGLWGMSALPLKADNHAVARSRELLLVPRRPILSPYSKQSVRYSRIWIRLLENGNLIA